MKTLILGGARSGKSSLAEAMAAQIGSSVTYIATAQAFDQEMRDRIERHQVDRPANWITLEEPLYLARILQEASAENTVVLVDCLTLWLSNLLCSGDEHFFQQQKQALLECLMSLPGPLIMVSNEVGQGIVPDNKLARRFVDEAGWLHQALARQCDKVLFVTAGLAQQLKP